jgi:hypothetical protein
MAAAWREEHLKQSKKERRRCLCVAPQRKAWRWRRWRSADRRINRESKPAWRRRNGVKEMCENMAYGGNVAKKIMAKAIISQRRRKIGGGDSGV